MRPESDDRAFIPAYCCSFNELPYDMTVSDVEENTDSILAANEKDLENAKENGVKDTMLDRLRLTDARIEGMAKGAEDIARLDDPVGKGDCWTRPNGLTIRRVRVPMGVVGVIFEARPNVAADVAALCIKSGNAVVKEICCRF